MRYRSFTVIGKGKFPFDMLRYDGCFPESTSDAVAIGLDKKDIPAGTRKINLVKPAGSKKASHPTSARWASFGWIVVE